MASEVGPPMDFSVTSLKTVQEAETLICFGMLWLKPIDLPIASLISVEAKNIDVNEDGTVDSVSSGQTVCRLEESQGKVLNLFKREGLQLQFSLGPEDVISSLQDTGSTMRIKTIIYGFWRHMPHIKEILSGQGLYLQDPLHPSIDTPYHNPQLLFPEPGISTTHERFHPRKLPSSVVTTIFEPKSVLADFTSGEDLIETECCDLITTPLKPHQKQALSFMLARESGWRFELDSKDLWSSTIAEGALLSMSPKQCHGGIIGDIMGYGKTLTMISLIAHGKTKPCDSLSTSGNYNRTTLIVVPANLLLNWDLELAK
ncbi:SMARC subfamily A3 [Microdochium nivale]|nr:SMARC subfamily A3 [Microdochium nivale]